MDFTLNDDQRALQEAARKFAQTELPALARELEEANEPLPQAWVKRYAEMGFLGINLPEAFGGQGMSHFDAVLVLEEFAKISGAVAAPIFESCFGPTLAIQRYASEELQRRVLPAVCAGEMVVAVSMSEPNAGSALTDLRTRGVVEGGQVMLDGQKRWCSGAGHAEGYLVYCRLSDAPGAAGIGAVFVDKGTPGLSFGKREKLMGFRSTHHCDIFLDRVQVPAAQIVVPAGGFKQLMQAFDLERCGNTTMSLGLAQGAFDDITRYIKERIAFGRPLADFQAVQLKIAEMAMKLDASRLLLYRAVVNAADGLPSLRESSIAKCFANEIVRQVCIDAMQLMGGYGYSTEYDMERRVRDSFGWGLAGGAIDIQKINIAGAVLGHRFDQRRS
ncbi:acyl-CoA dehydrogenase family protein [Comamonadaceae bacterium G21597-S1]|nr:acyl-CoA dehydrogenase family protein [Comamonadaceae bacterium G21597-S1]